MAVQTLCASRLINFACVVSSGWFLADHKWFAKKIVLREQSACVRIWAFFVSLNQGDCVGSVSANCPLFLSCYEISFSYARAVNMQICPSSTLTNVIQDNLAVCVCRSVEIKFFVQMIRVISVVFTGNWQ